MNNFSIYVSHSIRGTKGANATHEDMVANNNKAIEFAKELRLAFPDINFYVPAEHDEFVTIAYEDNILQEGQILDIDCKIIDKRDMILTWAHDQYISNGMMTELIHASIIGKDCAVVRNIVEAEGVINAALGRRKR